MSLKIWNPDDIWTPEEVLTNYTKAFRDYYLRHAKFYGVVKALVFAREIDDLRLWADVVAELFGSLISPGKLLNQVCSMDGDGGFPRPSQLVGAKCVDKYERWHEKQVAGEYESELIWRYVRAVQIIPVKLASIQLQWETYFIGPKPDDPRELRANCFGSYYRLLSPGDESDRTFAEYTFICLEGPNMTVVIWRPEIFCKAVIEYYPLRNIYRCIEPLKQFFDLFDPVSEKAYLSMTDISRVDFDVVVEILEENRTERGRVID